MVKKTSLAAVAASVTTLLSASAFAQDAAGLAASEVFFTMVDGAP
jgi:hypothetical protein